MFAEFSAEQCIVHTAALLQPPAQTTFSLAVPVDAPQRMRRCPGPVPEPYIGETLLRFAGCCARLASPEVTLDTLWQAGGCAFIPYVHCWVVHRSRTCFCFLKDGVASRTQEDFERVPKARLACTAVPFPSSKHSLSFSSPDPQSHQGSPSPGETPVGASTAHPSAQGLQSGQMEPAPSLLSPLAELPARGKAFGSLNSKKAYVGQHKCESRRDPMSQAGL